MKYVTETVTRITMVCKACRGYSLLEGTCYPTGPSALVYCPFCGANNAPERSEIEKSIIRAAERRSEKL